MSGIELLFSDNLGVYVPRYFARGFDPAAWNIAEDDSDWLTLMDGPDGEWYWDAWDSIISRAVHVDPKGNRWYLWQDGDLFAYCEALMTDEEYEGFYGEPRPERDLDNTEQEAWYDTSAELR